MHRERGNFLTFSLFQSSFRLLMGLIGKYWTRKVKKKCESIASKHPVKKSMMLKINIHLET